MGFWTSFVPNCCWIVCGHVPCAGSPVKSPLPYLYFVVRLDPSLLDVTGHITGPQFMRYGGPLVTLPSAVVHMVDNQPRYKLGGPRALVKSRASPTACLMERNFRSG
jgi:hypothetical protein